MVKFSLCMLNYFKVHPEAIANVKVFNKKIVGNFIIMLIDTKFVQNGILMLPVYPDL
jgi:arginine utilization protein RocB